MDLVKVSDLFEVKYGTNLELMRLNEREKRTGDSACFVSRTENNNGVSAFVGKNSKIKPLLSGTITVSGGGSVLETFLQPFEYYSGRDLYCLTPKNSMTEKELIFYCICIRKNKYRYNYGRQANKTLRDILIPDSVPNKFLKLEIKKPSNKPAHEKKVALSDRQWKWFRYDELFDLCAEKFIAIGEAEEILGNTPFISTGSENNGIACLTGIESAKTYPAGCITVASSGNAGEAFYQEKPFKVTNMVIILKAKFSMNKFLGLFLVTLIRKEKYRYSYGRKSGLDRMRESKMKLPVNVSGNPDWKFMEDFIKALPYSAEV